MACAQLTLSRREIVRRGGVHKGKIGGAVNVRKTTVVMKAPRAEVAHLTMP